MCVKERLRKLLENKSLKLSEYMAMCLYDGQDGYYTTHVPIGVDGDFITSPEISQLFGEMIAVWALDQAKDRNYNVIELGPGKGTLMADFARISHQYNVFKYHCVEISPKLRDLQKETLKDIQCQWSENFEGLVQNLNTDPCIFIANEFFDALPVDQYVYKNEQWHERHVAFEKDVCIYKNIPAAPPQDLLSKYPAPVEDDVLEYSFAQENQLKKILEYMKKTRGAFIAIDYGYTEYAYGDTFQAIKKHQKISPLTSQGTADLTSHVNFAYLKNVAESQGFDVKLYTQADFLAMMGIHLRYEMLYKQSPKHQKNLSQGLDRLINKMGYLFKVMVIKNNEKVEK